MNQFFPTLAANNAARMGHPNAMLKGWISNFPVLSDKKRRTRRGIETAILHEFCSDSTMSLIIRSSSIHAAGCYTTTPITKGTRVVEYTGPLIDKDEADLRYENKPITYLFAIGNGAQVIDGHGTAMFINHSCDANCETEEIDGRIWITAIRDIAAGEELCYDYCLYDGDDDECPCTCGAKKCRGTMFSPEELARRKKLAQKRVGKPAKVGREKVARKKTAPIKNYKAKEKKKPGNRKTAVKKIPSRSKKKSTKKPAKRRTG